MKNFLREQLTYFLARQYVELNSKVTIHGPCRMGDPLTGDLVQEAISFRRRQNLQRAEYLEGVKQEQIEQMLQLDRRSVHFIATSKSSNDRDIVACVRLTAAPFEMSLLNPSLQRYQSERYQGYFEFGRLCTAIDVPNKGEIAKYLLIRAGQWAMSATNSHGLIGICQESKLRYMQKFALRPIEAGLEVHGRSGSYTLIGATRKQIMSFFGEQMTAPFLSLGQGITSAVQWRLR